MKRNQVSIQKYLIIFVTYILIPKVLLGYSLDISDSNSVDGILDLLRSHTAATRDKLSADILSNSSCAVQAEQEASLQLALGTLDLNFVGADRHTSPLLQGEVGQVVEVDKVLGDEVCTPETGVRVGGREGHEAVGEVVGRDDVGEA